MKDLQFISSEKTPEVFLSKESNRFSILGRSIPDNPVSIYGPITEWLAIYSDSPNEQAELEVYLEYFNTSSHKFLLEIIVQFASINSNHSICWLHEEDDIDLIEIGEQIAERYDITVNFREKLP